MPRQSNAQEAHLCQCGEHAWKPITKGFVVFVSPEDIGILRRKWHANLCQSNVVYAARTGKVLMHHDILDHSEPDTDHRDGYGLNNRRGNLRPCTRSQNLNNRRSATGSASRYKGVSRTSDKRKWKAELKVRGKRLNIGRFNTEEEAAQAYNVAALREHGEFARLNVIQA